MKRHIAFVVMAVLTMALSACGAAEPSSSSKASTSRAPVKAIKDLDIALRNEGETAYAIQGVTYRIYSDSSKGTEEEYWGCLGVYREAAQ